MEIDIKIRARSVETPKMELDEIASFLDAVNAQIASGFRSGIIGDYSWEISYAG